MSDQSSIEWTESTWNPVRGCTKVSPGCKHCYAETFAERWRGVKGHAYEQGFDLRLVPEKLADPIYRKKPTTYFVNSMSDLFHDGVPDDYIAEVWKVMFRTPRHTYQILTKRAARLPEIVRRAVATFGLLPNVWLGVSVENQHYADERIPLLLQTPAAVRFISAEPLLGSIGIAHWLRLRQRNDLGGAVAPGARLDWVIVGGESGHGARPFDVAWARSIVQQCKAGGVPVFVKQLGARPIEEFAVGCDHFMTLTSRKGGDPAEWPEDLRVRQFPAIDK